MARLAAAASLQAQCGKVVIAVSEDIDPNNADAIFWSIAYRSSISSDVHITPTTDRCAWAKVEAAAAPDATLASMMQPSRLTYHH